MQALARFIMRGPSQAALVAAGCGVLSLAIPLAGLPGVAAVALVALRQGARPAAMVTLTATLGSGLLAWLALGAPSVALGLLLALWLPALGLGLLLRRTRALGLAVQAAGAGGLLLVLLVWLLLGDPPARWAELLEPLRQSLVQDGLLTAGPSVPLFADLARWMTGALAAALVFQLLLGLFIARWWQAMLFNPGGFGDEFRALRLHRAAGILTLLLGALGFVFDGGLVISLLLVLGPLLLLQGLAVMHQLHRLRHAHRGWLVGLYVLLALLMPQAVLLLAGVGLFDLWADLRARAARRFPGAG